MIYSIFEKMAEILKTNNYKKAIVNPSAKGDVFGALVNEQEDVGMEIGLEPTSEQMDTGTGGLHVSHSDSTNQKPHYVMEKDPDKFKSIMQDADQDSTPRAGITGLSQVQMASSQYLGAITQWKIFHLQTFILHGILMATVMRDWKSILIGMTKWTQMQMKDWKSMRTGNIKWMQLSTDPAKAIQSFPVGTGKAQGYETARLASMLIPLNHSVWCRDMANKPDFPLILNLRGRRYYQDLNLHRVLGQYIK